MRPSFANHDDAKNRFAPGNQRGKRSAERRMPSMSASAQTSVRELAPLIRCAAARPFPAGRGHARLSALTLAALATGYHPDGSAPEPGFPKTDFASVLPAWPSCLRLSTLRADRSFCRSTGDPEPPGTKAQRTSKQICNIFQLFNCQQQIVLSTRNIIGSMTWGSRDRRSGPKDVPDGNSPDR